MEPYVHYLDAEPPYCSCGEERASIQTAEEGLCYDCFTRQASEHLEPMLGYKPCGMLVWQREGKQTAICLVAWGTEHCH
jgi:hypothetical protein